MEPNYSKIFNKTTMQAVSAFCDANNIEDKDDFIYLCFKQGFDIKKFGLLGETLNEGEKHLKTGGIEEKRVEIEVIREIRVEVPVEVIKEVEKIIYTTDDIQINELGGKIAKLEEERQIFSTKTEEMENNFQNEISKKDKELGDLRQKLDDPVTNNNINMLQNTLQKLRGELLDKNQKIKELEQINKGLSDNQQTSGAYLLRGSNLNKRI
jgi:predicted RNase H-like nuclease (RuvC/YqgF family)